MVTLRIPMGHRGVEVLRDEIAGAYHVRVVAATDAGELAKWLGEAGFATTGEGPGRSRSLRGEGLVFRYREAAEGEAGKAKLEPEGLAPPLILAFAAKAPVYPLALTATAGGETEIVLWVVAPHRVEGGPLPTRFARAATRSLTATGCGGTQTRRRRSSRTRPGRNHGSRN